MPLRKGLTHAKIAFIKEDSLKNILDLTEPSVSGITIKLSLY